MAPSHYNGGNVWGRVVSVAASTSDSGTPFLTIQIDCSGSRGNVRAYGRLWKQERIDQFLNWHKSHPGEMVKLKGFYCQYQKAGELRSNYTWFDWSPAKCDDPRAAFILRGVVDMVDGFEQSVTLVVERPGSGGHQSTRETFKIYLPAGEYAGLEADQIAEVKGFMQQGEGEDDFGDATGPVLPTAVGVKQLSPF